MLFVPQVFCVHNSKTISFNKDISYCKFPNQAVHLVLSHFDLK